MAPDPLNRIRAAVSEQPAGVSIRLPKTELPTLPAEFEETLLGTPLWIAHPGSTAQHRATPAVHVYELEEEWQIHRDRYDPEENPVGHFFFDAPELPIAAFMAAAAGVLTYLFLDDRAREKDESDRNQWIPVLVALGIAALVGIIVYILVALVRVSLGVG